MYIKFSGHMCFLPRELVSAAFAQHLNKPGAATDAKKECKRLLKIFLHPALEALGEDRIMWGGDWRACYLPLLISRHPLL